MSTRSLVIGSPAELGQLLAARLRGRRLAVHLPWVREDRARWERRLSTLLGACGCTSGTIAMIGAVAGYSGIAFGRGFEGTSLPVAVGLGLAVLIVSAGIGKALGLISARLMLLWTVRRLRLTGRIRQYQDSLTRPRDRSIPTSRRPANGKD